MSEIYYSYTFDHSVPKAIYGKKCLVPDCNTLVYSKSNHQRILKATTLPIQVKTLHRGEAALRKHLREHGQKAALSSEIRKSRNKPRNSKKLGDV